MATRSMFTRLSPFMRQLSSQAPAIRTSASQTARQRLLNYHSIPSISARFAHTIPRPASKPSETTTEPSPESSASTSTEPTSSVKLRMESQPHYRLDFTCVPCGDRSSHKVSKQGYHHGSVLITCPSCRNRHVISDHLNIFGDRKITVEDLMREKGQLVKRGTLGEDGDVEFWQDESGPIKELGAGPTGTSS